jgi:hypothetical protein
LELVNNVRPFFFAFVLGMLRTVIGTCTYEMCVSLSL